MLAYMYTVLQNKSTDLRFQTNIKLPPKEAIRSVDLLKTNRSKRQSNAPTVKQHYAAKTNGSGSPSSNRTSLHYYQQQIWIKQIQLQWSYRTTSSKQLLPIRTRFRSDQSKHKQLYNYHGSQQPSMLPSPNQTHRKNQSRTDADPAKTH